MNIKIMCMALWTALLCGGVVQARVRVVATIEDLAAIAREVGGAGAEVVSLTKGTQNPHYIQVRPSDMIKVSRADVFVLVGLELELWAFPVLDGARNSKVRPGGPGFADCSQGIQVLETPAGKVDRSQGDVHPHGNPHYWLDPTNGKTIAKNILDALSRVSPENAAEFEKNYRNFCDRLDQSIVAWRKTAEPLRGIETVTYHKTWSYFANAFGLNVVNYIEPREGIPPSPRHVQDLIIQVRGRKVPVIVTDAYFDVRLPQKIAEETGAGLAVLAPSVGAVPEVKNYFDLFDYNLRKLREGAAR